MSCKRIRVINNGLNPIVFLRVEQAQLVSFQVQKPKKPNHDLGKVGIGPEQEKLNCVAKVPSFEIFALLMRQKTWMHFPRFSIPHPLLHLLLYS